MSLLEANLKLTPLDSFTNLYLQTRLGRLDCLGNVLGVGDYEAARKVSVPVELGSRTVHVLDIDALIPAKFALSRDRDREAVKQLTKSNADKAPVDISGSVAKRLEIFA